MDTITAIITSQGIGAVGALRISGPKAYSVCDQVFKAKKGISAEKLPNYSLSFGQVFSGEELLDQALLLKMAAPNSYTGEDVCELQIHGGPVVLGKLLSAVLLAGARMAEPGEFTKRAFLNGKLDLSQAEAVMDLVGASNSVAAKSAAIALDGALSLRIQNMKAVLIDVLAGIEASIDFPDEEEVVSLTGRPEILSGVEKAKKMCRDLLEESRYSNVFKEGIRLAFYGRPNVGKSSLLNVLLKEPRAIVTSEPGTTRDILVERVLIGGIPLILADTAGIRDTSNIAEKQGVDLAKERAFHSDLVLFVIDGGAGWTDEDTRLFKELDPRRTLVVINKKDIVSRETILQIEDGTFFKGNKPGKMILVSALDENCGKELGEKIIQLYSSGSLSAEEEHVVLNKRQIDALTVAENRIQEALNTLNAGLGEDMASIDIRGAWEELGQITGETVNESLVEEIFSKFCLGK